PQISWARSQVTPVMGTAPRAFGYSKRSMQYSSVFTEARRRSPKLRIGSSAALPIRKAPALTRAMPEGHFFVFSSDGSGSVLAAAITVSFFSSLGTTGSDGGGGGA